MSTDRLRRPPSYPGTSRTKATAHEPLTRSGRPRCRNTGRLSARSLDHSDRGASRRVQGPRWASSGSPRVGGLQQHLLRGLTVDVSSTPTKPCAS